MGSVRFFFRLDGFRSVGGALFSGDGTVLLKFPPGAAGQTGWEPTFAGLPVRVFQPQASGGFDQLAGFHFYFTGSGGMPMDIERSASQGGGWEVVSTKISSGYFPDTNPPAGRAFYRAVVP
jgi:hypothetical protein